MKFEEIIEKGKNLKIRTYPDPVLTKVATDVTEFDEELETLCRDMLHTMYRAPGIGLAAPQIGVSKRIFVMDVDYEREPITLPNGVEDYKIVETNPMIFINPTFSEQENEDVYQEGCLSLPGIYEDVVRAQKVKVNFYNVKGEPQEVVFEGMHAICSQHENDHLDGIVFIDRLSNLKKNFFKQKLIKAKKKQKAQRTL